MEFTRVVLVITEAGSGSILGCLWNGLGRLGRLMRDRRCMLREGSWE